MCEGNWHDYNEQKPETDGQYLVFADSGGFMNEYIVLTFTDGEWEEDIADSDIYWTPLPPFSP